MPERAQRIIRTGKAAVEAEIVSLKTANDALGKDFVKAVDIILACKGRVVVTGMGKSGNIAQKIAATLSSTGTPSFYLHPAEGVHGDLGMLVRGDVIIALSNSGETDEIKQILPVIKRLSLPLISLTGNINSTLGRKSDAVLNAHVEREACPMNLAPTSSTTVSLALGDALAVALVEERGFKEDDFALIHPSGSLGKRLLLAVNDLWHTEKELPIVNLNTPIKDVLYVISSKGFGCTAVVDNEGVLSGIITDGDLRRAMERYPDVLKMCPSDIMNSNPKQVAPQELAVRAMALMEKHSITSLIAVDESGRPAGIIHLHDLIKAGI